MEHTNKKQALIDHQKAVLVKHYPALWTRMIKEWLAPDKEDQAWLMYSANYLFRTGGIRWALDPLTLKQRLPSANEMDVRHSLEGLSFVLLTHRHKDHLDLHLIQALSGLPTLWIIPEDILGMVEQTGLARSKIIIPKPLEKLEIEGLGITPFNGLHWENDSSRPEGRRGMAATGYLVEFNGKRWLFPGDTRTYNAAELPTFGYVDGAFLHLWLGRGSALQQEWPLLASFCRFCMSLETRRIVVTHLKEFGRDASEFWDGDHFHQVERWLHENAPEIEVCSAEMGESIKL